MYMIDENEKGKEGGTDMADENEKVEEHDGKKDSPLKWFIILIINVALIVVMWGYYQKLKSETVKETIGTATVTMTATLTVQEKAIVGYNLAEVLYSDLKTARDQMTEGDFATAQETLTKAVNVAGLLMKTIAVKSGDENIDMKLEKFRKEMEMVAYHLNSTLEMLYKEENDKAMSYFTRNIDLEKIKTEIEDGKNYYINLLLESAMKGE